MLNPFENIVEAFNGLKNKNIRFNPKPWRETTNLTSSTPVTTSNDSFVDLHMEVAKKVDALIEDMEKNQPENQDFSQENIQTTLKQ